MAPPRPHPSTPPSWTLQALAWLLAALIGLPWSLLSPQAASASPLDVSSVPPLALQADQAEVLETLRLRVPAAARVCWLQAEASSWEPWLAQQRGYRGRQLFWDPQRQEAMLLIGWARRHDWNAIPTASLDQVQERFEDAARRCLTPGNPSPPVRASGARPSNPFPIVSSGELLLEQLGETVARDRP
ncbi:TIGR03792 family protein [Cyanobium sp. Morenito 9A2]|uniref:TIGR03792 family protein n=1 Tax=Cyanobium sp. Morenito 9A2 TaxID=2823718 RepID=UPI0020CEA9E4|nr:TIGR03792 family protein [Cyanobium sp. Morenito 9A2]MCP9849719.1 TIGR03792 family protein [Cyanobium sp. Morenito 9A2]